MVYRNIYIAIGLILIIPVGCKFGPNFSPPPAPPLKHYTAQALPHSTSSAPNSKKQYFREGLNIPQAWWGVFHSKSLNQLIEQALNTNPDLQAANAALKIAHENTMTQVAAYFPQISANYNPTRQLTAGTLASNLSSNAYLYTLTLMTLNIAYAPDVLGLNHRRVES